MTKDTLAQSVPFVVAYVLSAILAPFMLSRLGLAAFGVWAVTGALGQYVGLLDLGITRAISRFVALYDSRGEPSMVAEVAGLGAATVAVVGCLAVCAGALAAPIVQDILGVLSVADMRIVLISSAALLTFLALDSVFSAVPVGLRRMVPPNVMRTVGIVVAFCASMTALSFSDQLTVYATVTAAGTAVSPVLTLAALVYVGRRPYFAIPSRSILREVLSFSIKTQVGYVALLINKQTDKILIGSFVGVRAAGAYEVANRVVLAIQAFSLLSLSALVPRATAELVHQGRTIIRRYYRHYTTRTLAVAYPLMTGAWIAGSSLLLAWLGEVPPDAPVIITMLMMPFYVNMSTGVASGLLTADGRVDVVARWGVVSAGANIAATLALAPLWGMWGILVGTIVAETTGAVMLVRWFHRIYDLPLRDYLEATGPPALVALGLGIPFAGVHLLLGDPSTRGAALMTVVGVVGGYILAYFVIARWARLLPESLSLHRRPRPIDLPAE